MPKKKTLKELRAERLAKAKKPKKRLTPAQKKKRRRAGQLSTGAAARG